VAEINEGDLISKGALNEPKELARGLELANTKLLKLIETLKSMESSIKAGDSIKKTKEETVKLTDAERELAKVANEIKVLNARQNEEYIKEAARKRDIQKANNDLINSQKQYITLKEKEKAANNILKAQEKQKQVDLKAQEKLLKEVARAEQIRQKEIAKANSITLYEKERQNLNKLASEYRNVALAQGANSKAAKDLLAQHTKLAGNLNGLNRNLGQFNDNVGNYPKQVGAAIGQLVGFATVTAGAVLVLRSFINGIKDAIQTVRNYEDANGVLIAVMGKTKAETEDLRRQQIALGKSTEFSATQVTQAQTELARLGKTTEEIVKLTPSILNAATAFGVDLAPAAELVASNLNAFNLGASEGTRVADVLAKSTSISALNFERLKVALPKVGGAANQLGISLEKTAATLGIVVDKGIEAEKAGTSFRNIMLESAKAGIPYEKQLERINTSTDKLAEATKLFGVQDAIVAVAIAESTQLIKEKTEALNEAAGAAEEFAKKQLDTLTGDLKILTSAWEGFVLSIEDGSGAIAKAIRFMVQTSTALLNDLKKAAMSAEDLANAEWAETQAKQVEKTLIEFDNLITSYKDLKDQIDAIDRSYRFVSSSLIDIIAKEKERFEVQNGYNISKLSQSELEEELLISIENGNKSQEFALRRILILTARLDALNKDRIDRINRLNDITKKGGEGDVEARESNVEAIKNEMSAVQRLLSMYTKLYGETVEMSDAASKKQADNFVKQVGKMIKARYLQSEADKAAALEREQQEVLEYHSWDAKMGRAREYFELSAQIGQEASDIFANFAQRRIMDLEAEDLANQKKLENDLLLAGENLEKKKSLQDTYDAKKRAIDQQAREEQRKAAVFQKSLDLAMAISKLALFIISAGAITPQAIATGIVGGLQIAKIASTPIPAYAEGTDNHKGGFAIVGDGGGAELISEPNKAPYLSDSKAELVNLPKGTKVTPHGETMKMLAFGGLMRGINDSRQSEKQTDAIKEGFRSLERTIKNKKEHNIVGSITGYTKGKTRVNYIDSLRNR
jgi:hypothetical protein